MGDGYDTLNQWYGGARNNTLYLTDILPSEITLQRIGDELIVNVDGTGDTFDVYHQFFAGEDRGLGFIQFADNTVWTRETIAANAVFA